uniref:AP-3 complex subunit beta n=1 Tax=Oryzias sinensis TaxID=183150 RepID=A0A8C7ZJS3_9TELE
MQRLLQLPVNAVNMVKTVQSQVQGQEEAKSPVLTPDSAQQTWYNALQPDELRHLRSSPGTGGSGGGGGDQEERATLEEGGGGGGGSFQTQPLRHDDLKEMLDSNKDSLKLEAMKRIVAMIARGKNASDLFPAVVKNVACKNIEVKKLVYVYLVRYAEEQQDLALLSISTFQRGLKVQLISISAFFVKVSTVLKVKKQSYRFIFSHNKTSSFDFSLDPEQKDQLIEVIEKLLADKTTLVAGSVVMAFEEVCPERIDLIHKNYRKLCNLLIDVEEWGQVVIINMLTRYARTQFLNPNINVSRVQNWVYSETDSSFLFPCMRLFKSHSIALWFLSELFRAVSLPIEQSHDAALIYTAIRKILICCLTHVHVSCFSEVQYVVLQNVATMTIKRRGMFEPYLKSFYIRSTDPTQIKILKLEVLTNLANETNISTILREFQTYIKSMDKDFVAATIQAIGRCATNIGEVRDTCLNGLVQLLSNRDELVVAESVVVIKKLLQMQPEKHSDIIKHMAKLTDNIQVPMARASILWLIGEYCEHVPKIAPDVLRKMAKSFTNEEDIVKLQIINLAAKLYLTNSKQTKLLTQYVLNLAKYDQNYDIRDRARFIRQLIVPTEKSGALSKYAKKLFLALKPAPVLESPFKDRDHFQLGSLSHLLNAKAGGYQELPDWPEAAPDPSVRNVEVPEWTKCSSREKRKEKKVEKPFYSDSEGESGATESADSESDSASGSESGSEDSRSGSESDESKEASESEEEEEEDLKTRKKKEKPLKKPVQESERYIVLINSSQQREGEAGFLCTNDPQFRMNSCRSAETTIAPSSALKSYELLHRITGEGLSVEYCFSRQPFIPDANMVAVQVHFTNNSTSDTKSLHMEDVKLQSGMRVKEFPEIELLPAGETATAVMGIDFCDSTQTANFQLCTHTRKFFVSIQPPVGELMRPFFMTENEFKKEQGQLMGMNEITEKLTLDVKCRNEHAIVQKVTTAANLSRVPCGSDKECRFAGRTVTSSSLVLVTVATKDQGAAQLTVNCEKMVIGTMLVKDILLALTQ